MVKTGLKGTPIFGNACGGAILGIGRGFSPCGGIAGNPLFENLSRPAAQFGFWGAPPSIVPLMNSTPVPGDGELLKNAEGEESWLVTIAERGEASLDPAVVRPFIDCVTECC